VKLDRGLVAGIDTDPARQALVAGVRHFCASIDAQVIAEGIETEDELGTLRRLRVGLGQGYLMGRPVPAPPVREKPWPLIAEAAPLAS
jgi:EAL domain-containing protein (putative c-di-GMP-specific phosphodiesterase class I)